MGVRSKVVPVVASVLGVVGGIDAKYLTHECFDSTRLRVEPMRDILASHFD